MSNPGSYLCLSCGEYTLTGSFCKGCGASLSASFDGLGNLITKRLAEHGFESTSEVFKNGKRLIPIAKALEDSLAPKFERILMSPGTSGSDKYTYALYIVGLIYGDRLEPEEINALAVQTFDKIKEVQKSSDGFKVQTIHFRIYIIYKDGCSPDKAREHKLPRRKRVSRIPNMGLILLPVNYETGKIYGGSRFIESDIEVRLAIEQTGVISDRDDKKSFYASLSKLVFEKPIRMLMEYWHNFSLVSQPPILAHRIATNKLSPRDLFGIITGSTVLANILGKFFIYLGVKPSEILFGLPVIDGILNSLIFIVAYMFSAFIYHYPLKWAGGTATYRSTFIATGYVGAVVEPIIVFLAGVMVLLGIPEKEAWIKAAYPAFGVTLPIFAALHNLSMKRIVLLIILLSIAATFFVIGFFALLLKIAG